MDEIDWDELFKEQVQYYDILEEKMGKGYEEEQRNDAKLLQTESQG